jgi:hypothetical protein
MYWAMGSAVTNMGEGGGPPPQVHQRRVVLIDPFIHHFPSQYHIPLVHF